LKNRPRQSSLVTVALAAMSDASVFREERVAVCGLLMGSSKTLPHLPVAGSTRLGALPAAM